MYGGPVPEADKAGKSSAASAPQEGGRRERRRLEIRDRIYETAIELFLEQGFEGTAMDDIGDRADVARATVFNHYPRKAEFLVEWGSRRRAKIAEAVRRGHRDDERFDVFLARYMRVMAEINIDHRAETQELMPYGLPNALSSSPMAEMFAERIRHAQSRAEVRQDVDSAQVGAMLASTYFATIMRWVDRDPPPFELTETLVSSAALLWHGIRIPPE